MHNFVVILPVFNSYQNLDKIIGEIKRSNIFVKKIIIIDNNSKLPLKNKHKILKDNRLKYKLKINLIINKKNYGIGGSQKIIFNFLKDEKFDYLINLQTSGRFSVKKVLNSLKKINLIKFDYVVFSRFLKKNSSKNYNFIRRFGNIFFSFFTRLFTNCKISDPGMAINVIRFTLFKKIKANNKILNLTNDSHFPHLFNIIIFENKFLFKEKSISWGEGNIKSHLTAIPINYVINLLFYLLRYLIFGKFKPIKKNNFKYTIY
tara:strand:+ start:2090 stop:2872 length:783 start_codon:yes stop_codon:yes gene_type:complete